MSEKRSEQKNIQRFYCHYCDRRLWRLGSPKHFLFYRGALEIQENVNMSRNRTVFLDTKGAYIDNNSWLEEFICGEHGKLLMKVTSQTGGTLVATLECSTIGNKQPAQSYPTLQVVQNN